MGQTMKMFMAGLAFVMLAACNDDQKMDMIPEIDDSFYAELFGGEVRVSDPDNPGQQVEQGYLNLRTVVINTVMEIATNDGGAYDDLQPYFSVLLSEVGRGETSGFTTLVSDFTDLLAQATGAKNFTYGGLSMADAHDPAKNPRMNGLVNDSDYDLFIQAVVAGAAQAGITSQAVIGPVGELLESLRGPIVQRGAGEQLDLYTRLGGSGLIEDPDREGALVEVGYLALRQVVTSTVLVIATNQGGKYDDLQPYFSVLLAEVGGGNFSGFQQLVKDFSDFLAANIGSQNIGYGGMNMADAHNPVANARMTGRITAEDYDLFVEAVVEGALENGVPMEVILEFGAILNSSGLRGAIIQA
ncbi:hypothetical protein ADIS_2321 [Lunatimonas lonarensis]|uniref:Group 1 truncated hemoglobin n=1 Tax=Lunatimonas lonarensis TaxID=1232681 RepID=R7ZSW3_9BACT|nr:hypothetical protein [Lunatimonas lonarensis]EON77241.1 hypothetical protein ADIS_2321 [Lunatimonas lonarensis]